MSLALLCHAFRQHGNKCSGGRDVARLFSTTATTPPILPANQFMHWRAFGSSPAVDKPKLYYFPVQGAAEPIRLVMAFNDVVWDEVEVPIMSFWRDRDGYPFGLAPRFVDDDGTSIVQSPAVLRHLGRKYGMYGTNSREHAVVDMLTSACADLRRKFKRLCGFETPSRTCQLGDEWQYIGSVLKQEAYVGQGVSMVAFERILQNSCPNGDRPFLFGSRPSIADIYIAYLVDLHAMTFETQMAAFPTLLAHHDAVWRLPGVARYIASDARPRYIWAVDWLIQERQMDGAMLSSIAQHVIECS